MGIFSTLFAGKQQRPNPGGTGPQYEPGVRPPVLRPGQLNPNIRVKSSHKAVVTTGFDDSGATKFALSYGFRQQPDRGGALNYAYENYGLPLYNVAGAFMVARRPPNPFGSVALTYFPVSVPTGIGTIPGQVISQPLLDPQGPGSGFDIYS
jgi:hypothetical protein